MMTDTIIANLTPDALRSIVRSLLSSQPDLTYAFENSTRDFLNSTGPPVINNTDSASENSQFRDLQSQIRCMVGCGLRYQSLPLLRNLVEHVGEMMKTVKTDISGNGIPVEFEKRVVSLDANIVQAATAIQKTLVAETGARNLSPDELHLVEELYNSIRSVQQDLAASEHFKKIVFERGLFALANVLGRSHIENPNELSKTLPFPTEVKETFMIGNRQIPRIFSGLWQLSSPAWGCASATSIIRHFEKTAQHG